jgi:hypothetical protein
VSGSTAPCDADDVRRRFVVLSALRWLPNGLLVPVFALLWVDRGFTLGQIGIVFSVQAATVFILELPTGGLADAFGRRRVLILASMIDAVALAVVLVADSMLLFVSVALLMGVYRALESGPLDAWVVDCLHRSDPDADVEPVLGAGGVAVGLSIAAGALASAALVALGPIGGVEVLAAPVVVAVAMRALDVVVLHRLMTEPEESGRASFGDASRAVPETITDAFRTVRGSFALAALIGVEFFWGFGMVSFETLAPVRLAEVGGGTERAAAMFGPAATAAWLVSAAGASVSARLARRTGTPAAAMLFHAVQAACVLGMALVAGPLGVVAFYLVTMGAHGGANPLYKTLVNEHATAANRTTVLSAASMAGFPGFAIGGIALGMIADAGSTSLAMAVGAVGLACAIPCYLPALRRRRVGGPVEARSEPAEATGPLVDADPSG